MPLRELKIDRSFVKDILVDTGNAEIARAIVALAQSMRLAVVAEGVETLEQRNFLVRRGCRLLQGYPFGRPVAIHEFALSSSNSERGAIGS